MHDDTQPNGQCLLCAVYRPDRDGRPMERPPVCEWDRFRLSADIEDIGRLHGRLVNPDPVEFDRRRYEPLVWDRDTHVWVPSGTVRNADPVASVGGVAPIPSKTKQPAVSGSRERPAPTSLDALDLSGPARVTNPTRDHQGLPNQKPADAAGHQSVATTLDSWVRDWRDTLFPDQHLPEATVPALVAWLRAGSDFDQPGTRIDHACDHHPAIDDMATELRSLRSALRGALGETEPRPELIDGVTCKACDRINTLYRKHGDIYAAECAVCGLLLSPDEYTEHVAQLATTATK